LKNGRSVLVVLQRPTVFVLGAGSGVDVSMPTGAMLSDEIARKTNIRFQTFEPISGDGFTLAALRRIAKIKGMKDANPLLAAGRSISKGIHYSRSIDSYIHTHRHDDNVKTCGKVAIVQTILDSERKSHLFVDRTHPQRFKNHDLVLKSWLSDFMYLLQTGIGVAENLGDIFSNLTVINFNYDRCIEHFLYVALQDYFRLDANKAAELLSKFRIYHPYGKVAPLPWESTAKGLEFGADTQSGEADLSNLYDNIRTFNEEVAEGEDLTAIRTGLDEAERIIFLGFHFHLQNMILISSKSVGSLQISDIFATALDRSSSDIQIILERINSALGRERRALRPHIERHDDCKGLFRNYGELWTS
jgi:hypothetical protein